MRNTETVTVVVGIGRDVRPLIVWAGDRTKPEDRLIAGFETFPRRPHFLDEAKTRWKAEVDVPVGRVVTTGRGRWPIDGEIHLATAAGLQPMSYVEAMDHLDPDPQRIADRAAQRAHDTAADLARLPHDLARFVGRHAFQNGVHPIGNSYYFAERCSQRQAYWRRATRAEVKALNASVT